MEEVFRLFIGSDHDDDIREAIEKLPSPVEIKRIGKSWCVRIRIDDGVCDEPLPLAAIAPTLKAAARRMMLFTCWHR